LNELGDNHSEIALVCNGELLEENLSLQEANIKSGYTVHVYDKSCKAAFPSAGGCKKKLPANRGN